MGSRLRLDWVGSDAARYATTHWHYSRSMPTPPINAVGVWEDEQFIGVVIFSRGASSTIGFPFGLVASELCELTRVALRAHKAPVSRIVAIAVKMLKKRNPGLRLVVSFADPEQGHHGGIYQAGGWTYTGTGAASTEYVDRTGRRWHNRMVSASGMECVYGEFRPVVKTSECRKIRCQGKHRYALALDSAIADRVKAMARPYPKRVRSSEAEGHPPSDGGAAPTRTLHSAGA